METFIAGIILAIIQGISEWFPISSSGHLVLFSRILGFENSVAFDVTLHFGTLMAVFVYFGKDIVDILEDWLKGKWKSENARLGYFLIVSAIPAAIIGYVFKSYFESAFSSLGIVALGFAITGLVLILASFDYKAKREMSFKESLIIGCAQAVAIFPGISRSGSTISAGLLRGIDRAKAVRFSFMMSIPVIFGASILELGSQRLPSSYILPTFVSFIVGIGTIHLLLKILVNSKKNLRWFALYVLVLAASLGIYLII
jgi:undecaprenyl-diphosphatase